ncbi:unnamed protein product, partial [Rotaria sp. Silwood2]
ALREFASHLQSVFGKLTDPETDLCKDYEIRRKRAASPSMQNKSPTTTEDMNSCNQFTMKQS